MVIFTISLIGLFLGYQLLRSNKYLFTPAVARLLAWSVSLIGVSVYYREFFDASSTIACILIITILIATAAVEKNYLGGGIGALCDNRILTRKRIKRREKIVVAGIFAGILSIAVIAIDNNVSLVSMVSNPTNSIAYIAAAMSKARYSSSGDTENQLMTILNSIHFTACLY